MRISDWSSDVCSSDLVGRAAANAAGRNAGALGRGAVHGSRAMTDAVMAVWGDADAALEAEFNEWYHREHVPERVGRSEEQTSELQSLMRISYAVFCLKKKKITQSKLANANQDKLLQT